MRYDHRIIIGLTGAIGKMGPQSQIITNRVALQIGREVGAEIRERGEIRPGMAPKELWLAVDRALDIDPNAQVEETAEGVQISIRSCNICPKKVGKYALPATACPVGGIVKGAAEVVGMAEADTALELVPGDTCVVSIALTKKN